MTEILFDIPDNLTVDDDAETVIATITVPLLRNDAAVILPWFVTVAAPDMGVSAWLVRVRRDDIDGVQLGATENALLNQWFPSVDTPGLPSTITYVLTVELVDAGGASDGVSAVFAAIYPTP